VWLASRTYYHAVVSASEWAPLHELMENVISSRYISDGDKASEASDAWDRAIDSLHLSKSGVVLLNMLFIAELKEEIHSETPDIQKCREGPLATAIWSNINGVRNSVKAIAKIFVILPHSKENLMHFEQICVMILTTPVSPHICCSGFNSLTSPPTQREQCFHDDQ